MGCQEARDNGLLVPCISVQDAPLILGKSNVNIIVCVIPEHKQRYQNYL